VPQGYAIAFTDAETGQPLRTPKGEPFERIRLEKPSATCRYLSPKGGGQFPFVLPAVHMHLVANPAAPVVISEGEKKALRATLAGVPTIGLTGIDCWSEGKGSRRPHSLLARYLTPGRCVVMVYDSDGTTEEKVVQFDRSAERLARAIENAGCAFRRTFVPAAPDGAKRGLDDWLQAGTRPEEVLRLVESASPVSPRLPRVLLPGDDVSNIAFVRQTADAVAANETLFIHCRDVVSLGRGEAGSISFEPLNAAAAASEFERFAVFGKMADPGGTGRPQFFPSPLPESKARLAVHAPEFARKMPHIRRICDYQQPCRSARGGIVLPALGYDSTLKTYTNPAAPKLESFADVESAVQALMEVLGDFCFERPDGDPDQFMASAIAYLLTADCRLLFEPDRAPLFYAGANRPGCGKDLLLGLAPVLTTGVLPQFYAPAKDAEESRKRLFAIARSGARFYIISNARGHLDDTALEAALTSPVIADRVLGESRDLAFSNTAIYALSGNSLTYTEDLARRCIRIQLAYYGEEIETRRFCHPDLYAYALEHRGRYLGALRALVSNWITAGCPDGTQPKASFTKWAAVVGGILEAAHIHNPIGRDTIVSTPTEEVQHMRALLAAWHDKHGDTEVEAAAVRELALESSLFGWIGDMNDRGGQTKFSRMLGRNEIRSFGGFAVSKREAGKGHTYWRCRRAEA